MVGFGNRQGHQLLIVLIVKINGNHVTILAALRQLLFKLFYVSVFLLVLFQS